jgi:hypothetical protein
MYRRGRLLLVIGILALFSGVSVDAAQAASSEPSQRTPASLQPRAALTGGVHSAPAQWVKPRGAHVTTPPGAQESSNWSGYVDTGSTFTAVSASWVVPAVQSSTPSLSSGTWIGIDGASNSALIQTGTAQITAGGQTAYYDWYELLPSAPINLESVSPGDEMHASIVETSTGNWAITITDATSEQTNVINVAYNDPQASAEWIEEAPTSDTGQQTSLAEFGTVQFSGISETSTNQSAVIQTPVEMVDISGNPIATPGPLTNAGFTITDVANTTTTTSSAHGYWLVGSDGGIFTFGGAQFYGSTGALKLERPVVGIALTPDRRGYWLVASDGGVFSFPDAGFFGSIPGLGIYPAGSSGPNRKLNAPIVGLVPSADGGGYFMVAADGGVFAFGDAKFEGSCPAIGGCSGTAVAVMPDASGNGYWLVTATGNVYAFGNAASFGSPGPQTSPVTSAMRTPDGNGYWILFANGAIANYGDAVNAGAPVNQTGGLNPATAIYATSDGAGYWVSTADGDVFAYGDAPNDGNLAGVHLNGSIIAGVGF